MLKPNLPGNSSKRRLRMVDLPAPEGPEITIGWWAERASLEMGMVSRGAMVEVWWMKVRKFKSEG
jgi:hypothetical protein